MRFALAVSIFLISATGHGWTFRETVKRDASNQLKRTFQAACTIGESICIELCHSQFGCEVAEDSCLGCLTDTDLVVRSMILDGDKIYEIREPALSSSQTMVLFSYSFSLVSATSFANVFSDPKDKNDEANIRTKLQLLCPHPTSNPVLIIAGLNRAITCENEEHSAVIYPLGIRNEFQKN